MRTYTPEWPVQTWWLAFHLGKVGLCLHVKENIIQLRDGYTHSKEEYKQVNKNTDLTKKPLINAISVTERETDRPPDSVDWLQGEFKRRSCDRLAGRLSCNAGFSWWRTLAADLTLSYDPKRHWNRKN
jgi:hypothetical protein